MSNEDQRPRDEAEEREEDLELQEEHADTVKGGDTAKGGDGFLNLNGIEGESAQAEHKGWIE